jgi:ABC-type bacteriocin/lantibiotic exporter with double-glycine peptidase domain
MKLPFQFLSRRGKSDSRFLSSSIGRLPGTSRALLLIVVAGSIEGIGLAMFVPLIQVMTAGNTDVLPAPFDKIGTVFRWFGLSPTLLTLLAVIFVMIMLSLAVLYIQRKYVMNLRHTFAREIRIRYAKALFKSNWAYLSEKAHGEAANEFIVECNRASMALQYELLALGSVLQIMVYMAVSSVLSWELTLVVVGFCGVVGLIVRPKQLYARKLGDAAVAANRNISFHVIDFLRGGKLIKSTASEPRVIGSLTGHIENYFRIAFSTELNSVQIYFIVQALPVILLTGIIIISHSVLALTASYTLVFMLILARIAPRLAQFQQYAQGYNVARPGLSYVDEMIDAAEDMEEVPSPDALTFDKLKQSIRFDQVTFRYPTRDRPAIEALTLEIPRHRMVAIVGPSGSGKSTVVDLIAGLRQPHTGEISIDGIPLGNYDVGSWRRRIGYVTQDVIVFNDTLRNNISFGAPEATDADILQALEVALLKDVLKELPDGLDTFIGENGTRLSGGQRQRLALARAILGKPELLLLDEATSALDNESERLVQQAIEAIAENFTLVVIAHRLSTVRRADIVHVMEDGRIVQSGTYDALLAKDGTFRKLHGLELT